MTAKYFIPFMEMPFSVSVKTSSYTIPAGYYARAIVNLVGTSNFTIDGSSALECNQHSVLSSDNLKLNTVDGVTGGLLTNWTTSSSPTASGTAFNETSDIKIVTCEFRLPTGTLIDGSGGWRATVELYPMPS